jgi:hypothetical protein
VGKRTVCDTVDRRERERGKKECRRERVPEKESERERELRVTIIEESQPVKNRDLIWPHLFFHTFHHTHRSPSRELVCNKSSLQCFSSLLLFFPLLLLVVQ